jgi:hypothetical protein
MFKGDTMDKDVSDFITKDSLKHVSEMLCSGDETVKQKIELAAKLHEATFPISELISTAAKVSSEFKRMVVETSLMGILLDKADSIDEALDILKKMKQIVLKMKKEYSKSK